MKATKHSLKTLSNKKTKQNNATSRIFIILQFTFNQCSILHVLDDLKAEIFADEGTNIRKTLFQEDNIFCQSNLRS